mmetsp:Transcript_3497/g.7731  ORF Transcript_3497/g.7731 Transcript_3497/m.7731 type:complete len:114 (-) Transcript_3497:2645-2986(-)
MDCRRSGCPAARPPRVAGGTAGGRCVASPRLASPRLASRLSQARTPLAAPGLGARKWARAALAAAAAPELVVCCRGIREETSIPASATSGQAAAASARAPHAPPRSPAAACAA